MLYAQNPPYIVFVVIVVTFRFPKRGLYESIRGGDFETSLLELLAEPSCLTQVSLYFPINIGNYTHDLLLSPSFLNFSIICNISFLPPEASIIFPPMDILIFVLEFAFNSLFMSKCLICIQT